jgi:hypothetical protein
MNYKILNTLVNLCKQKDSLLRNCFIEQYQKIYNSSLVASGDLPN